MKEKFRDTLGSLGIILYFILSLIVSVMPFVMIDTSFWQTFLFCCIEQLIPLSTLVFWIWGLVCAVKGTQDFWTIAYYILFAVMYIPFILDCIISLIYEIKKPKQRFCKFCGNVIDSGNKKCTGCGKQYFRLPKLNKSGLISKVIGVLSVLIVVLCVWNNIQYQDQITQLNSRISELEDELSSSQETLADVQEKLVNRIREVSTLSKENQDLETKVRHMETVYDFCNDHVVVVSDDGTRKYHRIQCPYFDDSYFWAYNTEKAQQLGYSQCTHCFSRFFNALSIY